MENAYSTAITSLMDTNIDYRALAILLAKDEPSLFNKLINKINGDSSAGPKPVEMTDEEIHIRNILGYTLARENILAIKEIRVTWGLGLKESKDIADNLQNAMSQYPSLNIPDRQSAAELDSMIYSCYDKIWDQRHLVGIGANPE
jgi:hypothetical protein